MFTFTKLPNKELDLYLNGVRVASIERGGKNQWRVYFSEPNRGHSQDYKFPQDAKKAAIGITRNWYQDAMNGGRWVENDASGCSFGLKIGSSWVGEVEANFAGSKWKGRCFLTTQEFKGDLEQVKELVSNAVKSCIQQKYGELS